MKLAVLLPLLAVLPFSATYSAELQNAKQLVSTLEEAAKKSAAQGEDSQASEFQGRLDAFSKTASSLSPEMAAEGWLELYKASLEEEPSADSYRNPENSGFNALVKALPPPTAWEALKAKIAEGPTGDVLQDQLLNLFAATLCNDPSDQWKALKAIQALSKGGDSKSPALAAIKKQMSDQGDQLVNSLLFQLLPPLVQVSDNPDNIIAGLKLEADILKGAGERYPQALRLPNIAVFAGEKKASDLLENILATGLSFEVSGEETRKLAVKIALKNIDKLKRPQWGLIEDIGPDEIKLYEAMAKKFPAGGDDAYERKDASEYYLLSLILAGKTEAADAWLAQPENSTDITLSYQMLAPREETILLEYFFHALAANPNLPFWSDLVQLAAGQGKSTEALEFVRKHASDERLSSQMKGQMLQQLSSAALANGSIDEAIGYMRQRLQLLKAEGKTDGEDSCDVAIEMAQLGQLLKRDDLREEGIREALAAKDPARAGGSSSLIKILVETGRSSEAQQLMLKVLEKNLSEERGAYVPRLADELANLAGIFDEAKRPNEVMDLLLEAPWWGEKNLGDVCDKMDFRNVALGEMAARALSANGDKEKALAAIKQTIRESDSDDSAYRLLTELEGQNAIAFLDERFARNRFEERPLIWKAVLLLSAGKIDEADKVIRAAIAIDPSDGEMGPGNRMRAYSVLADILEKQGKADDAKVYRGAVQAIRLSEEADKYRAAGLLSQSIAMYENALTYFADAYCIQSRLAIQLADLGDMKKAEEHYRRAYELMPDSFGRMESHCFGCERAFKGEMAESLAERTFMKMIQENPAKPQTYYLMGYLRTEQDRDAEALPFFQKAVELDPDYINAWQKILSLDGHILLPNKVRNEAFFAILRLNPSSSHSSTETVTDLQALWPLVEKLRAGYPAETPDPVLALRASKDSIESGSQDMQHSYMLARQSQLTGIPSPGALLTRQKVIESISSTLSAVNQISRIE